MVDEHNGFKLLGNIEINGHDLVGDTNISDASPDLTLTSSGDSNPLTLNKSSTNSKATIKNKASGAKYSVAVDGTNDHIYLAAPTGLNAGSNAFSFACWFYCTRRNNGDVIMNHGADGLKNACHLIWRASNHLCFDYYGASNVADGGVVTADAWHHALCTYDAGDTKMRIYIDGALAGTSAAIAGINRTNVNFSAGGYPSLGLYMAGYVDDCQYWNETLTLADAQNLYAGTQPSTANLKLRWNCNDGTGTTATDDSGTGNNGTLTSGASFTKAYNATNSIAPADAEFNIITAEDGPLITIGSGTADILIKGPLRIEDGASKNMGTAVLIAGTVTVNNTRITSNSRVFLTAKVLGGTQGILSLGTVTANTSFVINSSNAADTSTVSWLILEPN